MAKSIQPCDPAREKDIRRRLGAYLLLRVRRLQLVAHHLAVLDASGGRPSRGSSRSTRSCRPEASTA